MKTIVRHVFGGWGRRAAWAVLILFVLMQAAFPSFFQAIPRLELFDVYQQVAPRVEFKNQVVIVDVDEASLKEIGQWPWPRQILAQLITKLSAAEPVVIGVDLILPEADRLSPEEWLRHTGSVPAELQTAIRRLPSHDAQLSAAIAGGPVVIGIAGLRPLLDEADKGPLAPFRVIDAGGAPRQPQGLPDYNASLRSIGVLDGAAAGHGMLSVDPDADGVFRRMPLVSSVSGRLAPSLALEMLRVAAKAPLIDLHVDGDAVQRIDVGPLQILTQVDATVWVHFTRPDPRRFVSASDVLAGRVPDEAFKDAIVLIGVSGLGTTDLRMTSVGYMPGTEISAQLIENILARAELRRPGWTALVEPLLTLALGAFLIVVVPLLRGVWQIVPGLAVFVFLGVLGFALWDALLLFDVATPALGLAFVLMTLTGVSFAEADAHRRHLRRELEARKLAEAKVAGEMEAGRRIQMGMLPGASSVAGDNRFDLGALMVPARQIGGDLYDFFKLDERRLFFTVGDVSGKGVPAALFMALGKSLCKSYALRGETDVGSIIQLANIEISRDNPEMLFITMFVGILNLDSGEVQFCNAGHDAPFLLRRGSAVETITCEGGPPLCVVEDFAYKTERLTLQPGDLLCVTTDGVAEAMDASGALLGVERTKQILSAISPDATANAVVDELYAAVGRFVGGAEASDDLTVLAIRWNGP